VANCGALVKAIDYTLERLPALSRCGQSQTSANRLPYLVSEVKNAIRLIALGKNNWLFADSERAGKRAAIIQSLFATARLNETEPTAWSKEHPLQTTQLAQ
jgi:hypothetical protein